MANTVQVKLTIPKGDIERIDELVAEGKFASRADFGHKAVFLLLTAIDGTQDDVKNTVSKGEFSKT